MSDPFQPAERRHEVTYRYLRVLAERNYPTVISTKGDLAGEQKYRELLSVNPKTIVQVSLVSTRDKHAHKIEPQATPPSRLLRVIERLSKASVIVTCRLQPYLGEIAGSMSDFVRTVSSAGAKQISIEHLKAPLESIDNSVVATAREKYRGLGALRDGREYVLPAALKRNAVLEMRSACRDAGVHFGCADNEFQFLSDSWACCSGVDIFPGFENYYRFQIGFAVRRSRGTEIKFSAIENEWHPEGSIDRYLNSRTRLSSRMHATGTVKEHIKYRWNFQTAPGSPSTFFGVIATNRFDNEENRIYSWASSSNSLFEDANW